MEDRIRQSVVLGALLHDIGKFWQRADPDIDYSDSHFLQSDTKRIIGDFCPKRKGNYYSHLHSAWTYQFLVNFEGKIYDTAVGVEDSVIHLAANHHNPRTTLQELIRIADWTSSAMDRSKETEDEKDESSKGRYKFRQRRLRPVFESIFREDYQKKTAKGTRLRYRLKPLDLSDSSFPFDCGQEDKDLFNEYRTKLWEGFEKEFARLPRRNFSIFVESLLPLLQKYAWCIPSSTGDNPDISLYDHLKTTAAIATCLYDYLKEKSPELVQTNNKSELDRIKRIYDDPNERIATLICGDLSGIQKFIYQISSTKAALSLKGRSFALQLMSHACARHFLRRLDLPLANLIYSSGGNFYILVANKASVSKEIDEIQSELNSALLNDFGGDIFLGVGTALLSARQFDLGKGGELNPWVTAIHDANESKRKRFQTVILRSREFFKPFGEVDKIEQCDACGRDVPPGQAVNIGQEGEEEKILVCPSCNRFIETGKRLRKVEFILETDIRLDSDQMVFPLSNIPIGYMLARSEKEKKKNVEHLARAGFVKVYRVNNTDFLPEDRELRSGNRAYGFIFLGGNLLPQRNGSIATFEQLALGEEGTRLKRLAVLRMDVDNLGEIFKRGFREYSLRGAGKFVEDETNRYSISRLSTLSTMLDWFFSGYLNALYEEKYRDHIAAIYSGGDDLFIVGRWDRIVDFAEEFENKFSEFTCSHPSITISGGIVVVPSKYPIHRAADLAGNAEERSKELKRYVDGEQVSKDAVTFLDKTISWNDFRTAMKIKDEIHTAINEGKNGKKLNRAIIGRLRTIYAMYSRERLLIENDDSLSLEQREELINHNKWRWRMVYSLSRLARRNPEFKEEIDAIQKALAHGRQYKEMETEAEIVSFLDVPTRWAELLLRTKKEE